MLLYAVYIYIYIYIYVFLFHNPCYLIYTKMFATNISKKTKYGPFLLHQLFAWVGEVPE